MDRAPGSGTRNTRGLSRFSEIGVGYRPLVDCGGPLEILTRDFFGKTTFMDKNLKYFGCSPTATERETDDSDDKLSVVVLENRNFQVGVDHVRGELEVSGPHETPCREGFGFGVRHWKCGVLNFIMWTSFFY